MLGIWNSIIKTPYMQFYTIFTVGEDESGHPTLDIKTEPFAINFSIDKIQKEGNIIKATGKDLRGMPQKLELCFENEIVYGTLSSSIMGNVSFTGSRGRGNTLADNLRKFGEKSVEENRYWKAKWIWDKKQPEENNKVEHQLVFFRRTFDIENGITPNLKIEITADSRYRLFVNGKSVAVGPCKGDRHVHYYETVDVSRYLVEGTNVLAVQVLHYPFVEPFEMGTAGPISVWRSQSAGLFVEACLKDENGEEVEQLHSDAKWKVFRHQGYRHVPKSFIQWMGGVEEVEGKAVPHRWKLADFDDSSWKPAIPFAEARNFAGNLSPWNLVPRPIPLLYEEKRSFVHVTNVKGIDFEKANNLIQSNHSLYFAPNNKYVIEMDAGELTTGYLSISVQGGRGSVVRIKSSECYEYEGNRDGRQRVKGNREDTTGKLMGEFDIYHVAGYGSSNKGEEVYEPFLFRTFRYVQLEVETGKEPLELKSIHYRETGYPLEVKAKFECSDDELNKIWDLSVRTLKRCMHETYEDCPYYEQLQYAMDSRLMMLFTYFVSADDRMPRRTILDFYNSRQPSGMLQSRYPSMQPQVIPSFALYWIDMIAEHYEFNCDPNIIVSYRPAIIELLDWYHERLTDDGIIGVTSNRFWTYFDWVEAWALGAPPESMDRPMYLLSFMYAHS